ncbi:hypothetical protein HNQ88_000799 [Aureibacter tunicatorum]|uniref:Uncharacterized protein n=1 Tax=Aureibacter tunicatorum TaxID=866807 RepID=A0AAE4BRD1_9BACT|nr:hypothetical protein [Aureibacter tunicatorum]BDD02859.1 hypothetical protein AUTU_03420 [Aureibacter tunicatorum]
MLSLFSEYFQDEGTRGNGSGAGGEKKWPCSEIFANS